MANFVDLTGSIYRRLTVLERAKNKITLNGRQRVTWKCQCSCGNVLNVQSDSLRSGTTKSCGCLFIEVRKNGANRKHGDCGSSEYIAWYNMLQRCNNPKNKRYRHWGGRGITVCKEWMRYENFIGDMGKKPSKAHSLDRINVDGNYEPFNCRWALPQTQRENQRAIILDKAREELGMSVEQAITAMKNFKDNTAK